MEPTTARPPRSEPFLLALVISAIHLVLLAILAVIAWRSPFLLMRLPERVPTPPAAVVAPAASVL